MLKSLFTASSSVGAADPSVAISAKDAVSEEDYAKYMSDGIHPNKTGYVEWWTPQFEAEIAKYMAH